MVDPVSGAQQAWTSQHASAAIALWTDAPAERAQAALGRIAESQRLTFTAAPPITPTGATLEPEDGVVLANTFYSHFVYDALARHGGFATALRLMRERYGPMLARGATTLWESFEPTASLCHGFSATPTYQLSRRVLGVAPAAPGYAEIELAPDLADLAHAAGVVPTPRGDVEASLERTKDGFVARYRTPTGVGARAVPPPDFAIADWPGLTGTQIEIRFERTKPTA